ncbi:hypothetical protein ACFX2H_038334 [Malus domestica]
MGEAVLLLVKESNGSLKKWKPCSGMLGSTAKVDVEEEEKGLFLLTSLSDSYENLVKLYCMERYSWNRGRKLERGSERDNRFRSSSGGKGPQCYGARPGGSKFVAEGFKRKCGNFVWLDGLLLETGVLTSFQVADNEDEKNLLEETRMCRDPV